MSGFVRRTPDVQLAARMKAAGELLGFEVDVRLSGTWRDVQHLEECRILVETGQVESEAALADTVFEYGSDGRLERLQPRLGRVLWRRYAIGRKISYEPQAGAEICLYFRTPPAR
jgi:hypothetical protein